MEVYVPTLTMALAEIAIGAIFGGIIRSFGWAVSVMSLISFVVSAYLFLDLNPNTMTNLSSTEFVEKISVFIIGGVNFLLHTALFDTGTIIANRVRSFLSGR